MKNTAFILIGALGLLAAATAARADALTPLVGKKRVLVLFDKSRSSAPLDRQIDSLRQRRPDMSERDLVVISNPGLEDSAVAIGYIDLPRGTNRHLRTRFKPLHSGLTVILIGKDGTEKARWQKIVPPSAIFDLIDSMPMRKKEIEESAVTN